MNLCSYCFLLLSLGAARAACWSPHASVAAAASAFCRAPAVARALTQRAAGLPQRLEAGLQRCAARFTSASGDALVFDSLGGTEDAVQQVWAPEQP